MPATPARSNVTDLDQPLRAVARTSVENGTATNMSDKRRKAIEAGVAAYEEIHDLHENARVEIAQKNVQLHQLVVEIEGLKRTHATEVEALKLEVNTWHDRAQECLRDRDEAVEQAAVSREALRAVRDALERADTPYRPATALLTDEQTDH